MRYRVSEVGGTTYIEEVDDSGGCCMIVLIVIVIAVALLVQGIGMLFGADLIGTLFDNLEGITGPCGTCVPSAPQ